MKKLILAALLALGVIPAGAQQATVNSPVARPAIAKYKVDLFYFKRGAPPILLDVLSQDSSDVDISVVRFAIPSAAGAAGAVGAATCTSATSLNGLAGAMNTARGGEPAGAGAAQQYRQLGYLIDQGCLTGVTLSANP